MQSKYRKMYNENLLGTSDVSILKFYYASFKIQQQKGKISDVNNFLDECIKIASDTSRTFKIVGFIPYFSSKYSTEQQRISKFISLRRNDIATLFLKDDITDKEVEDLLYGISMKEENTQTTDNYIELIKEKILKCYSIKGRKQLGDRIFGYLLASELIPAYAPEERLQAWLTLFGEKVPPSDTKLHANPSLNRSNVDSRTLLKHLDTIREFYFEIGLTKTASIIEKDMKALSVKA
jgi:chaperonin cofactor prefoldin